jgi:hypothetical protein
MCHAGGRRRRIRRVSAIQSKARRQGLFLYSSHYIYRELTAAKYSSKPLFPYTA